METSCPDAVHLGRAIQSSVTTAKLMHPRAARTQESLISEELNGDLEAKSAISNTRSTTVLLFEANAPVCFSAKYCKHSHSLSCVVF